MDEMYFDLKKGGYIRMIGDDMEIKSSFFDVNDVLHKNEVVKDKIENFRLIYFSVLIGCNVVIELVNEKKRFGYHIEIMTTPKKAKEYDLLKEVMDQYGCFEGRTLPDSNYQKYNVYAIMRNWREKEFSEDQKEQELSEEIRLIECPCCKAQISNQAPACPKCGQPIKVEKPQKMYRINPSGNKEWVHCPKCGSENCSRYREQHYIPGETEVEYTKNLNPLKPFTIANRKEKIIREEKVVTKNRFICNDCGKVFD